jgi:YgiT-type zinc finger domain-containing protein
MTDYSDILSSVQRIFLTVKSGSPIQTKEETMNCMYCSGNMERGIAPFHTDRKGYHITLDRIPAWVCAQCGEVYFDEPEVEAIQEVLCTLDQRTEKLVKSA